MPPQTRVTRLPKPSLRWRVELLWSLSAHRVNLRYKETLFGFGWIFLQPVALTIIFTYIFHRFAKIPSSGIPYPLFAATGLVAWSLTALVVTHAASCLTSHQVILKRVAFPKILLPFSVVVSTVADLAIMALLLIGLLFCYRTPLPESAVWVFPVLAIHLSFLIGLSCLFSLANVFVRDVGQALNFLLQLWFFVSPVFYPYSMVPGEFKELARWNPMTGLIEGYRAALFLGKPPEADLLIPAFIVALLILVTGVVFFWRLEGTVADVL